MWDHHSPVSSVLQPRGMTELLAAPESIAGKILNFVQTKDGTLRSIQPPVEYIPRTKLTDEGYATVVNYGPKQTLLGLFHGRLDDHGSREILLAHFGGYIQSFQGWKAGETGSNGVWKRVIGDNLFAPYGEEVLPEDGTRPGFPTQFVKLPSGVLIIPQGTRAYVYDGYTLLPLGYDRAPGAPEVLGPSDILIENLGTTNDDGSAADEMADGANQGGYLLRGRDIPYAFGDARIGRIDNTALDAADTGGAERRSNSLGGVLMEGERRAVVQWINKHGDLSPLSGLSAAAHWSREDNLTKNRRKDKDERSARMKVQVAWTNVSPGPTGTIGRILGATRDLVNSGDPRLYELTTYAAAGANNFATLPDNESWFFPDNIPEGWLLTPMTEVDAMPLFRLGCMWAGRLWVANMVGAPGMLRASMPGKWGTLPKGRDIYYPDPTGAAITGMRAIGAGMLVFTETSTYLFEINQDGGSFRSRSLHPTVGCVAPDSIRTLLDGTVVWMSREGFHAWKPGKEMPEKVSTDIEKTVKRINRGWRGRVVAAVDPHMGEYRCWVPLDAETTNTLCLVYDGSGWRMRDDCDAQAVCVTDDHLQYMLALGTIPVTTSGSPTTVVSLWCLDHAGLMPSELAYDDPDVDAVTVPRTPQAVFETHWLRANRSHRQASPVRVELWLRETADARLNVEIMRDYRENPIIQRTLSNDPKAPALFTDQDPPAFLDATLLGGQTTYGLVLLPRDKPLINDTLWRERRLFWRKHDILVPSAEVFKMRIRVTGDVEFVGINYVENEGHKGGLNKAGGETQ